MDSKYIQHCGSLTMLIYKWILPKNAVGEIIPVLLATTMEVPLSRNGAVKSTTASLSAFILREVRTISNFLAMSAAINPFHFPFYKITKTNKMASISGSRCKKVRSQSESKTFSEVKKLISLLFAQNHKIKILEPSTAFGKDGHSLLLLYYSSKI